MNLSIIVGMTKRRVIGKGNSLPWHIPEDLKNFKEITTGKTVIMGRKTYDSIISMLGKPLPNRNNIVISRSMEGACRSIEEAVEKAKEYDVDAFVIGGATIYKQFLPIVDRMYISWIKKDYEGDVLFPEFSLENFEVEERRDFPDFEFVIYKRK